MEFSHKHDVAAALGSMVDGGVAVEIGSGDGGCTMAINGGMMDHRALPIICMDEYGNKPEVKAEFLERTADISHRIILVDFDERHRMYEWRDNNPATALLWIDSWIGGSETQAIVQFWDQYLIPDAYVGIVDCEPGLEAIVEDMGYERILTEQDYALAFRKRPPKRAAFYIASDEIYCREADRSAWSVKEHMGLHTILFLTEPETYEPQFIDEVKSLPPKEHEFWYFDSTRYFNMALDELKEYDQLLYLDTDTYICCEDAKDIFLLLNQFDLAIGHSPQRDGIESAVGTPASFSTMSIGVNAFRNNDPMREFFAEWLERYEEYVALYDNNDQAPLRDALYENKLGIRWVVLAPEFSLRFDFGAWVVGAVRILHGRESGKMGDLQHVCNEINSDGRMRIWRHGLQ